MTPDEALEKACELAGNNDSALARKIGATQNAVWQAKQRGKVSAEMAMAIEQALDGAVKARDLRPDLPWPNNCTSEPADSNASAA
jgi:DNA-binding transcriptional regulator YdaS (Cro superfamily)